MSVWHLVMFVATPVLVGLVAISTTSKRQHVARQRRGGWLFSSNNDNNNMKWNADQYQRDANYVATLGEPLLELLQAQPHERILDLGCGNGSLTSQIPCRTVVGVDSSPHQVRAAVQDYGIDARVVDGHDLAQAFASSSKPFHAVLSNAALHWMKRDPAAVVQGVHSILQKPGGRLVGEMGGFGNVQTIRQALQTAFAQRGWDFTQVDPWYFPTREEYQTLLQEAGFTVRFMELFPRPTHVPNGIRAWLQVFVQPLLEGPAFQEKALDEEGLQLLLNEVEDMVRPQLWKPHENGNGGDWYVDYVRLRFHAVIE